MRTVNARDAWNPTQYERFRSEREQPFHDLVALITRRPAASVIDLGCGTGLLTAALHRELSATETLGVDSSEAMLERARTLEGEGLTFERGDISHLKVTAPFDVVFSNAALQWVGDHERLVPRLFDQVAAGGVLAVQMPRNHDFATHRLMRQVAAKGEWRDRLAGAREASPVKPPEFYYDLLAPRAAAFEQPLVAAAIDYPGVRGQELDGLTDVW